MIGIKQQSFGTTTRGETVTLYEMNTPELIVRVLDYGATIQAILVRDKDEEWVDVVLGYDTIKDYQMHVGYLGACVGRVANRLGDAQFTLNGKVYSLSQNKGKNHVHGGFCGFDKYVWHAEILSNGVKFSRVSPDGEEGYPGNLMVSVTYCVKNGTLSITYDAVSDQDTLCNLTNHSYFNLNGDDTVLSHMLQINADYFLENSVECMPTGKILSVEGTPMDFRKPKKIGDSIMMDNEQLKNSGGYDHNFCLQENGELFEAAALHSEQSGITMRVSTTMPGMQLYTANFLGPWSGKGGTMYHERDAVCLETQFYPNAMQCRGFKKPILKANERYYNVTEYSFTNR